MAGRAEGVSGGERAPDAARWFLTRRLFLGALALVYGIAFASLAVQVEGLYGSAGIASLAERMRVLGVELVGWERLQRPTLLWFGASDARLALLSCAGLASAALALGGVLPRLALLLCWLLYLSFVTVGSPFLDFQWDALLLESGLLAVAWAPGGVRPFARGERAPSRTVRWLLHWLLFRLMVLSGAVKLAGGDPAWRDGTALAFHFWTQPLPHRLAHFAHHVPVSLHRLGTLAMFALELVLPCLLLVPWRRRRLRQAVAAGVVLLMAAISATGNYGFFNLLACVLCIPLLDDRAWRALFRRSAPRELEPAPFARARAAGLAAFALLAVLLTTGRALRRLHWSDGLPEPLASLERAAAPLASFNAYGLFERMTRERPELAVEGSADGRTWKRYRFRFKPDALDRPPAFAGPHMPRLDWQMWFAALEHGSALRSVWIRDFLRCLLDGSTPVLALLAENPFPDAPPRFVRIQASFRRFSTPAERARGIWWEEGEPFPFFPAVERAR